MRLRMGASTQKMPPTVLLDRAAPSEVVELRRPVRASTVGRTVEDRPERPHEVDVARVLPRGARDEKELAAPEVVDPSVAAGGEPRPPGVAPLPPPCPGGWRCGRVLRTGERGQTAHAR